MIVKLKIKSKDLEDVEIKAVLLGFERFDIKGFSEEPSKKPLHSRSRAIIWSPQFNKVHGYEIFKNNILYVPQKEISFY